MFGLQKDMIVVDEMVTHLPPALIDIGDDETSGVDGSFVTLVQCQTHGDLGDGDDAAEECQDADRLPPVKVGMRWQDVDCEHANWDEWSAPFGGWLTRRTLAKDTIMRPRLNITLDGGTWLAAAGLRATGDRPSLFTNLTKREAIEVFEWVWLEAGESVRAYCKRVARGRETAFLALAAWAHRAGRDGAGGLGWLTRVPERIDRSQVVDEGAMDNGAAGGGVDDAADDEALPGANRETEEQRQARRAGAAAARERELAGDGAQVLQTWRDARTRAISPDTNQLEWLKDYVSEFDGDLDTPVAQATFVRVPVPPEEIGSRPLPKAAWGDLPVMKVACLCILHGAMRTAEHWLTRVLQVPIPSPPPSPPHRWACCKSRAARPIM